MVSPNEITGYKQVKTAKGSRLWNRMFPIDSFRSESEPNSIFAGSGRMDIAGSRLVRR